MFSSAGNVLLLAFGFGFVIFWHELGHFLAAKWADVKVEQFAVGFGQALFSWRKGLGFRWGSSGPEYQAKLREQVERTLGQPVTIRPETTDAGAAGGGTLNDLPTDNGPRIPGDPTDAQLTDAAKTLGLSDTEYRLNWIPLGGYVKMLGQDDLRPGIDTPDPRSYTSKPVGKRMVIVSAGVVMNVILAAIGFIVYFSIGPKVTAAVVGEVVPGSPAAAAYKLLPGGGHQPAPLRPGDHIERIDGHWQADNFDKIKLNTPLLIPGEPVPVEVLRADGITRDTVLIAPERPTPQAEFPLLGIAPARTLEAVDAAVPIPKRDPALQLDDPYVLKPGDRIVAADGHPLVDPGVDPAKVEDDQKYKGYLKLDAAIQAAAGRPVPVRIHHADGTETAADLTVQFVPRFGTQAVDFAGLQMLPRVLEIDPDSAFRGKLHPGDVVVDVIDADPSGGHQPWPTKDQLYDFAHAVADGDGKQPGRLQLAVLRDGKRVLLEAVPFDAKHVNTGVSFDYADATPVVADPPKGSAAADAHVPAGAVLRAVNGQPVRSWFDVWRAMQAVDAGQGVTLTAAVDGRDRTFTLRKLTTEEATAIRGNRLQSYGTDLLQLATATRRAKSPVQAAEWGLGETRDAVVQVYLTVRAMVRGSISPREFSGPLGILAVGYKFAEQGSLRLLWFLSIISANLAVMNFLPIPVVDGGLFTFLIIEKLKGSPINQRTQVIAQYAGLTLLLSVFLFATWQDLFRLPLLFHG